ncbi:MAG TPA: Xaa-Pro peptidase family protein [Anaerolineaceae bacterium]|nr:Xaa-Pro peptidase family protein [Anaerolineaceae bacterium]
MSTDRLNKVLRLMRFEGLDALALNPGPSLVYLTGLHFHLMERPVVLLIPASGEPVMVLPELEASRLEHARLPLRAFPYADNPATWENAFRQAVQAAHLNGVRVGVEATRMRFLELSYLQKSAPGSNFEAADFSLSNLRIAKDREEVEAMRQAARVAEDALQATLPAVKEGISEAELAGELVVQLLRAGSDSELPFSPIVAFGENSANPHSTPSDRRLKRGDLVLFDWGASCQGYISDITRTFSLGEPDGEFRRIAEIVKAANEAGRQAARGGIPAGQVDLAARQEIEKAGYGPYFIHRTGHGIGMEGHEAPYIFAENQQILEEGMAFTVEPGIYLPGRGGVRIEDNVVITGDGAETLTSLPRELIQL